MVFASGSVRTVDASEKRETRRGVVTCAVVEMQPDTLALSISCRVAMGDVPAVARVAHTMAAKRPGKLIPLCHPPGLESASVEPTPAGPGRLEIRASVSVTGRTGIEMEALTAAAVAAPGGP